ncbi:MAG: D-alanine--D-alanine ligase [Gemmatimonadales bacterium]
MKVLLLSHQNIAYLDDFDDLDPRTHGDVKTEYDVRRALLDLGYDVQLLGGAEEIATLRKALREYDPDVVFNLMEEFRGEGIYVPYILGYLELQRRAFTGCNPAALIVTDNKPTAKKLLKYHRIPVADFAVFARQRRIRRPKSLDYPLIVKSSSEHGSVGIAQASVVTNDEKLAERVQFIHEQIGTDAIAERYIHGRELYVGLVGNNRLQTLPTWELVFGDQPEQALRIATSKAKWDIDYQERRGITSLAAAGLSEEIQQKIVRISKRAYRILGLSGYARMDFRLTDDNQLFLLEANPNPDLAYDEDFSDSAAAGGLEYEDLIRKIVQLGAGYRRV